MKVNTNELNGLALDWAVASCLGNVRVEQDGQRLSIYCDFGGLDLVLFSPATDWTQGGPLISGFEIALMPTFSHTKSPWLAVLESVRAFGSTPLEAVCRSIVMHKIGRVIEVPDDLCGI